MLKKFLIPLTILFGTVAIVLAIITILFVRNVVNNEQITTTAPQVTPQVTREEDAEDIPLFSTIAENLDTPWALVFLPARTAGGPDQSILVTERPGRVRLINADGSLQESPVATLENVREIGEGGLLGMTLHPQFQSNNYVYLYYTYAESGGQTLNRVIRMTYQDGKLQDEEFIVDRIPGAPNHNGGRIKFGPDGFLYTTTGDAQNPSLAQITSSLAGKILRVTDDGKPVPDNPFNNLVYSYGHRNSQGLAWSQDGTLWATEHGRSGIASGLDELNLIEIGKNYGWPEIQGDETKNGMVTPKINSGPTTTWAPAGAAYLQDEQAGLSGSVFFAGLRGQTLYQAVIKNDQVTEIKEHFKGEFGRLRDVALGPDDMLYITTSNRDGRGNPLPTDDKIIRVNPKKL